MKRFVAVLRLVRLGSSLSPFLAILVPLFLRTNNLGLSLGRATPILFICFCTFIANALDDIEKDRVNHPERPLPAQELTPAIAVTLYFIALFLALFLARHYVPERLAFWYYGLIAISISYGYIVDFCPVLKVPYVAATVSALPLMMTAWFPTETRLYFVVAAVFLFTAGKEICMDIRDRQGDPVSYMHRFKPAPLAIVAFTLEGLGLLVLMAQSRRTGDVIDSIVMTALLLLAITYWFKVANYRRAIFLMRLQFLLGIYFLI